MRLTYDPQHHVGYLHIVDPVEPGAAVRQESLENDDLVLDFDADGRLLGIEFLAIEAQLRPETLALAQRR